MSRDPALGQRLSAEAGRIADLWVGRIADLPSLSRYSPQDLRDDCVRYIRALALSVGRGDLEELREAAREVARRHAQAGVSPADTAEAQVRLLEVLWQELILSVEGEADRIGEVARAMGCAVGIATNEHHRALRAALAVERAEGDRLRRRLAQEALSDELTGLSSESCGLQLLQREMRRARRHGRPLAVLVVAPDDADRALQTRGTSGVEEVVKQVAAAVAGAIRETDLAWRLGEVECAAALPETTDLDALRVADRIRSALEAQANPGEEPVAVSVGIAALSKDLGDPRELVSRAREACQHARRLGSGFTVRWDDIPRP